MIERTIAQSPKKKLKNKKNGNSGTRGVNYEVNASSSNWSKSIRNPETCTTRIRMPPKSTTAFQRYNTTQKQHISPTLAPHIPTWLLENIRLVHTYNPHYDWGWGVEHRWQGACENPSTKCKKKPQQQQQQQHNAHKNTNGETCCIHKYITWNALTTATLSPTKELTVEDLPTPPLPTTRTVSESTLRCRSLPRMECNAVCVATGNC